MQSRSLLFKVVWNRQSRQRVLVHCVWKEGDSIACHFASWSWTCQCWKMGFVKPVSWKGQCSDQLGDQLSYVIREMHDTCLTWRSIHQIRIRDTFFILEKSEPPFARPPLRDCSWTWCTTWLSPQKGCSHGWNGSALFIQKGWMYNGWAVALPCKFQAAGCFPELKKQTWASEIPIPECY